MIDMGIRVRAEMPGDGTSPARARGWQLGAAGIVACAIYWLHTMITSSAVPNGYRGRHWDVAVDGPWPYPTSEVRNLVLLLALDALVGVWFLQRRSKTRLALRGLAFGLLNFLGLVLMVPLMMHIGQPLASFAGWLLFASGWGVLFAMAAAIASLATPPAPRT